MYLEINQIIKTINKLYKSQEEDSIIISICSNDDFKISTGNISYYSNYKKMIAILELNKVNLKDDDAIYEVLSKHFINQLSASLGKKVFPAIEGEKSDFI